MAIAIVSTAHGADVTTNATSITVALPDGSNVAGRRLVVAVVKDGSGAVTWPSGWTVVNEGVGNGSALYVSVRYRDIDGSEGYPATGATITCTGESEEWGAYSALISGHDAGTAPEASSATGATANADYPSLTPSWGSAENVWLIFGGWDAEPAFGAAIIPNGWQPYFSPDGDNTVGATNGVTHSAGAKISTAATEDPAASTVGAEDWRLVTVAVRPATGMVARALGSFEVSWASYVQGLFRLGVSQIGLTDTLGVSPSADRFTGQFDAIAHVLEFSYARGRTDDYSQVAAGTGSVLVRDPDGRFNEANPASPLFGLIEDRLHPARLAMTLGGVAYPLFYGFTRRIEFTPTKRGGICSFELVDLFYWLQRDRPVIAPTGWTNTGAVIGLILDAIGWVDPAGRLLDKGDDILSYEATGEKTALQLIEELLEVERGLFFIDGRGRARFVSRHSLLLATSQAAIVNQMRAVSPGVDFDHVRNYAEVAREGSGIVKTALDQPSINRVGRSEWSAISSPLLRDENQAQGLADYLVSLAKSARPPLHSLQIDNRTTYLLRQVLERELGEVVTVSEAESGTTGDFRLEHLRVGYAQKTGRITASYLCSRRPMPTPPFRLGVSQLNGSHVLVY